MGVDILLPVGTTLNKERYNIIRQLKSGGFGNTYEVKDSRKGYIPKIRN